MPAIGDVHGTLRFDAGPVPWWRDQNIWAVTCLECGAHYGVAETKALRGECDQCKRENRRRDKQRNVYLRWGREAIKRDVYRAVKRALKSGELVRPKSCERCGGGKRIAAHHDDYSKPLQVQWLCSSCHGKRHAELEAEGKSPWASLDVANESERELYHHRLRGRVLWNDPKPPNLPWFRWIRGEAPRPPRRATV